jgi:tetratricopeptide (TPR) repeat protein
LLALVKLQDGLGALHLSLAIAKPLAEQDESNSAWQQDLSVSYNKVGDALVAQVKLPEALNAYQQGLKIRQILAEQDKSNAGWQRDLSLSYDNVGDVLVAQGKFPEALDAYQQSLRIREVLAEQNKSNSDWQRDLIVSLYQVGATAAKIGGNDNVTRAQELLRTALGLALVYSGRDREQLINALSHSLQNLAH